MHNEKLEWPIRKSTKVECKRVHFLKDFFKYKYFYPLIHFYLFILISNIQDENSVLLCQYEK